MFRKKVWKTVWLLKYTKSKARNFTKNQWGVTRLKLDLELMVIDFHAKNEYSLKMGPNLQHNQCLASV